MIHSLILAKQGYYFWTAKAELVAVALALKQVEFVHFMAMKFVVIFCDNQGAIKIFRSASCTVQTGHRNVKLQFAKDLAKAKYQIRFIRTEDDLADTFTKP